MAKRVPSRGSEQFMLRLPDGMRERIKMEADENGRSMNAEIIERLERSLAFEDEPQVKIVELAPIGLDLEKAIWFVGTNKKQFIRWWRDKAIPNPINVGGTPVWRVEDLNKLIDQDIVGDISTFEDLDAGADDKE